MSEDNSYGHNKTARQSKEEYI